MDYIYNVQLWFLLISFPFLDFAMYNDADLTNVQIEYLMQVFMIKS